MGEEYSIMGMDLKPLNPSIDAPTDEHGVVWGRYNWTGWSYLCKYLESWGVPLHEFDGCNDGREISAATCRLVADAIEKHLPELSLEDQNWLQPHIVRWRTCGGYAQF